MLCVCVISKTVEVVRVYSEVGGSFDSEFTEITRFSHGASSRIRRGDGEETTRNYGILAKLVHGGTNTVGALDYSFYLGGNSEAFV